MTAHGTKPAVFVGSSTEGLTIARKVELHLDPHAYVTLWTNGVFGLGQGTLETLVSRASEFDFAVLVLTPDDLVRTRGTDLHSPRDNVVFELGLFMGKLGRERTFVLYNRDRPIKLPTDLAGVTCAEFGDRPDGNLEAAVSPACGRIIGAIERLKQSEGRSAARLTKAANDVERVSRTAENLIRLLAESRAVELDAVTSQFGALITPTKLAAMKGDLTNLVRALTSKADDEPGVPDGGEHPS